MREGETLPPVLVVILRQVGEDRYRTGSAVTIVGLLATLAPGLTTE